MKAWVCTVNTIQSRQVSTPQHMGTGRAFPIRVRVGMAKSSSGPSSSVSYRLTNVQKLATTTSSPRMFKPETTVTDTSHGDSISSQLCHNRHTAVPDCWGSWCHSIRMDTAQLALARFLHILHSCATPTQVKASSHTGLSKKVYTGQQKPANNHTHTPSPAPSKENE